MPKYILLLIINIAYANEVANEQLGLGGPTEYFILTLPSVTDHTACFPQGYVKSKIINGKIDFSVFNSNKNRIAWESEGLIGFSNMGKIGYCDRTGEIVIKAEYDSLFISHRPFVKGVASVMIGEKYYYIDKLGKTIAGPYEWAYDFKDNVGVIKKENKWGLINNNGEFVVRPTFKRIDVCVGGIQAETFEGESGFIDNMGIFIKDGDLGRYHKHP